MSIIRAIKPLIAVAVFGDKPEAEEGKVIGEAEATPKTPEEICALIEGSRFAAKKKARVLDTYRRFSGGETYAEITAATGRCKAIVSQDLQAVEDLTGERVRPGDAGSASRPTTVSKRELVKRTRAARGVGKFSASLYGWHSFRTSFVTLALQYGVPIEDVRKIVGHATARTTEDYNRATKQHTAERITRQMAGSVLDAPKLAVRETINIEPTTLAPVNPRAAAVAPALPPPTNERRIRLAEIEKLFEDGLIDADERKEQRARILNEI